MNGFFPSLFSCDMACFDLSKKMVFNYFIFQLAQHPGIKNKIC